MATVVIKNRVMEFEGMRSGIRTTARVTVVENGSGHISEQLFKRILNDCKDEQVRITSTAETDRVLVWDKNKNPIVEIYLKNCVRG